MLKTAVIICFVICFLTMLCLPCSAYGAGNARYDNGGLSYAVREDNNTNATKYNDNRLTACHCVSGLDKSSDCVVGLCYSSNCVSRLNKSSDCGSEIDMLQTNRIRNLPLRYNANATEIPPSNAVSPTPAYARVREKNVYFYSSPMANKILFALIPTYYLKVLAKEGLYYRVEIMEESSFFCKLIGFVKVDSVEAIYSVPASPLYPAEIVVVTAPNTRLYLQPSSQSDSIVTATNAQQMGYYGKVIADNVTWYYVSYGDYLGYVDENNVSSPSILPHPTPLSVKEVEVDIQPEITLPEDISDSEQATSPLLEQPTLFALILLIVIPVVVIVILLFAPEKKSKKSISFVELTATESNAKSDGKPRYYDDYI